MIQFQDSILEHLHHHTLSNMLSNMILEAHCAWILSSFSLKVGTWFMARPISPTSWLSLPILSTMLHLDNHIFQLQPSLHVFSHPIDLMDIHLLHCTHGNEHVRTHDVVHDTFATARCWLSHGMKTTTCAFFNHVQFVLSTSQLCSLKITFAP